MCGICGVWRRADSAGHGAPVHRAEVLRMTAALAHRGPDGEGVHLDRSLGIGCRRLAVVDRSPAGAQPMSTPDGRYHLVHNGEIYNHRELRPALEAAGHRFRSGTDTETLLYLWAEHGPRCLLLLRGMFAFAVWDRDRQRLFLARDRFGQKPLFYTEAGATFAFASEIKALLRLPEVRPAVDPAAIDHFLSFDYVPAPATAFTGIVKLPPAHWLEVDGDGVRLERYWRLSFAPGRHLAPDDAAAAVIEALAESVRLQLMSDAPLGLLLSGGLDSSTLLAVLAEVAPARVRTFTVAFPGASEDESAQARATAAHFGAEHQEIVVEPEVASLLPRIVEQADDLFADTSIVPTWCLAREAARSITVALGGDGGDELFAGYQRYRSARLAALHWRSPAAARAMAAGAAGALLPARLDAARPLARVRRFLRSPSESPERAWPRWTLHFDREQKRALYSAGFAAAVAAARGSGGDAADLLRSALASSDGPDFLAKSLDADLRTYLPDDILYKVDLASMAHSLEVRAPFLDHPFAELVASLPSSFKLRGLTSKWLLRRGMRDRLPAAVVRGRKRGFGLPLAAWLGGELAELLRETLLSRTALERGWFERAAIERLLADQAAGRERLEHHLWNLMVLELWHRAHLDPAPGST